MPYSPPEEVPRVEAKDFPGLATRADPDDLADGAGRDQVNVSSHRPGELRTRPGYLQVTFEEN